MKYLKLTSKTTLENVNRAAWERKIGRDILPGDSEFIASMTVGDGEYELQIQDEDVQHFTVTRQNQMTDEPLIATTPPF